jgi:hypothetical protein
MMFSKSPYPVVAAEVRYEIGVKERKAAFNSSGIKKYPHRFENAAVAFAFGCVTRVNFKSCASTFISVVGWRYGFISSRVHLGLNCHNVLKRSLYDKKESVSRNVRAIA